MSVYDWIETRVPGGHGSAFGRLLDVAYNEEYGAETTDQSSLNILYLLAYQPSPKGFEIFGVSDERYHIAGGNQRLPEAIAATLPDVRLGWRMTSVAANADGTVTSPSTPLGRGARRRRPGDPDDAVPGAAHPRLLAGGLRRAQADTRSRSSGRVATRSCSSSSRAATGTRAARGGSPTATPTPTSATRTPGT